MGFRFPLVLGLIPILLLLGWWLARQARLQSAVIGLRALSMVLLIVALAQPGRAGTLPPAPLVLLVDQSASLPADVRAQAWQAAQAYAAQPNLPFPVRIAAIGAQPLLVADTDPAGLDPGGTDLAGALQLASGLLPYGGNVVLLSDGGATTADPLVSARQLRQQDITVYSVPLTSTIDSRITAMRVPELLRENQQFSAEVLYFGPAGSSASIELASDGQPIANQTVRFSGESQVALFPLQINQRGFHTFSATIRSNADPQPNNNTLESWTIVGPPPRVLVVERAPDTSARLRDQLEAAGLVTEAMRPPTLPSSLSQLSVYDSIVLQDVPAAALSLEQQLALREFVRSQGHGLVVIGGSNSYSLGGYAGTPLEEVLPVSMQPPPKRERPTVALLLLIDRSASMLSGAQEDKFSLAKAAAIAATDTLGPNDSIGVVAFETVPEWAVEFSAVGSGLNLSTIQAQIAAIEAGGGTNIYGALELGLPALAAQSAPVRHAVLFTDGRSITSKSYEALIAPLREQGLTLSTIAIGADADQQLLETLARLGSGRYHYAAQPSDLPRLTLQETEIARQNPLAEGLFSLGLRTPHPAIRGLDTSTLPPIKGYIATTLKDDAEGLLSADQDVVLAAWQYGLGRSIAWTTDANERWTEGWASSDASGSFWSRLIAATYPDPRLGALHLSSQVSGAHASVTLDALDDSGAPIDLADVGLRVVSPDGSEQLLRALQTGPGRYAASIDLPTSGAYQVLAALEHNGQRLEARSGVVRSYPAELRAAANPTLLEQLSTLTAGAVRPSLAQLPDLTQGIEPPRAARSFWPLFVGLALLAWIFEVAWRRGWLDRWRRKRGF